MDNEVVSTKTAVLNSPVVGQFLKFCIVGAVNTVVDFGVYIALTRPFPFWERHLVLASVCSFSVAVASSFFLNNFWTFGLRSLELRRSVKFVLVAIGGLCWNALTFYALHRLGTYDLLAKAAATGVVLAWNFTLQKKWTFRA